MTRAGTLARTIQKCGGMRSGTRHPRRGSRGYTLIELVVAMAVAAVLFLSMAAILAPVYRTYQRTLERSDARLIAENVLDALRNGTIAASALTAKQGASGSEIDAGGDTYAVSGGLLTYRGDAVFAPAYYAGKTISLTASQLFENTVLATVTVAKGGETLASASAVLSPLKNVLVEYDTSSAAGLYLAASGVLSGGGAPSANAAFNLVKGNVYAENGGAFPVFDLSALVPNADLTALAAAAAARYPGGYGSRQAAYYIALRDSALYLGVHIAALADGSLFALPFVTTVSAVTNSADMPAYLIYYKGLFYAVSETRLASAPVTDVLTLFEEAEPAALVADTRLFVPLYTLGG